MSKMSKPTQTMSKDELQKIKKSVMKITTRIYEAGSIGEPHKSFEADLELLDLIDSYTKEAVREADVNETKLIEERDRLEENLDSLTQAAALYFKTDFGEHSSANNPWFNAFQKLRDETITSEETGGE